MKALVISLVMAFVLVGCSSDAEDKSEATSNLIEMSPSTPDSSDFEEVFVDVLVDEIPEFGQAPESAVIDLGKQICIDLEGLPITETALLGYASGLSEGADFLSDNDAGYLIGVSTAAFCPEIADEITELIDEGTNL